MADILTLVVRYAHILSAILWIGGLGFAVLVLGSAIGKINMPSRKEMLKQLIPAANRFLPMVAVSTILFGTILYLLMGNFDSNTLLGMTWGRVILTALILAVGLLTFGLAVVKPASMTILGHLNEEACTHGPEVARLQKLFARGQVIALIWGFVILSLMVYATGM